MLTTFSLGLISIEFKVAFKMAIVEYNLRNNRDIKDKDQ